MTRVAWLAPILQRLLPLAAVVVALGATACDLDVHAHADVPLGSRTLHITYDTGSSNGHRRP
jgi:hypothetical protein